LRSFEVLDADPREVGFAFEAPAEGRGVDENEICGADFRLRLGNSGGGAFVAVEENPPNEGAGAEPEEGGGRENVGAAPNLRGGGGPAVDVDGRENAGAEGAGDATGVEVNERGEGEGC
jgi:hypothetical protein